MIEQVTPVPNAAHFVDGVVFSRGQVVPALNLRARFGFERRPTTCRRACWSSTPAAAASGWSSTRRASSSPSTPRRSSRRRRCSGLSGRYLEGVANIGDRLVLVLNLAEALTFTIPSWNARIRGSHGNPQSERPRVRVAPALDTRPVLAQAEAGRDDGRRDRAHHRRSLGGRGHAAALARSRARQHQRDGRVAERDGRAGGSRSAPPRRSSGRRSTRWPRRSSR
jgi:purine-binding chemotaxis protein CheW